MDPDRNHIWLILMKRPQDSAAFYLEIPIATIHRLCSSPLKYLLYLGWCILGFDVDVDVLGLAVEGEDGNLDEIDSTEDVKGGVIYHFVAAGSPDTAVVDLEVIKSRTAVPSETTATRNQFRNDLLRRDKRCVFTGLEADVGDGLHLIPFKRGSEWFRLIIENRPHEVDDNIRGLDDINDVRNGFFATKTIHPVFDRRSLAILKTPNRILDVGDIPPHANRTLADNVAYPANRRYTAQWLMPPGGMLQQFLPDNTDATFGNHVRTNRPSDLLLHYNYGAAAVKFWGRGADMIEDLAKRPDPIQSGPSKGVHNRNLAIKKRKKAQAASEKKVRKHKTSAGEGSTRGSAWDEDDIMLFFWGNSKVATKRYIEKREAKNTNLEQWRQGVDKSAL